MRFGCFRDLFFWPCLPPNGPCGPVNFEYRLEGAVKDVFEAHDLRTVLWKHRQGCVAGSGSQTTLSAPPAQVPHSLNHNPETTPSEGRTCCIRASRRRPSDVCENLATASPYSARHIANQPDGSSSTPCNNGRQAHSRVCLSNWGRSLSRDERGPTPTPGCRAQHGNHYDS